MFGGTLLSNFFIAAAAVAGFAVGALLTRLMGSSANRPMGKRADDLHHTIRGLEADLRVAQRTAEQAKTERDALTAELGKTAAELGTCVRSLPAMTNSFASSRLRCSTSAARRRASVLSWRIVPKRW